MAKKAVRRRSKASNKRGYRNSLGNKVKLKGMQRPYTKRHTDAMSSWWANLSPASRKAYLAKHPNSVYGKRKRK